jgi:hypothetical protein
MCKMMLPADIFSDSAMAATVWPAASFAGKVPFSAAAASLALEGAVRSVMFGNERQRCKESKMSQAARLSPGSLGTGESKRARR